MRNDGVAAAQIERGAQVKVTAALAVGGAEQVGQAVRVFCGDGTIAQRAIGFQRVGIGRGQLGHVIAHIPVLQGTDVVARPFMISPSSSRHRCRFRPGP